MRRFLPVLALVLASTLPLSGCATLLGGFSKKPEVGVIVEKPEANVTITLTNLKTGEAKTIERNDARFELDKAYDYKVTVSAPGYEPQDFMINRTQNALVMGNASCAAVGTCVGCVTLVLWPITIPVGCAATGIGFGVDYLTNNAHSFNQPDLYVTLKKAKKAGLPIELRDASGRLVLERIAPPIRL